MWRMFRKCSHIICWRLLQRSVVLSVFAFGSERQVFIFSWCLLCTAYICWSSRCSHKVFFATLPVINCVELHNMYGYLFWKVWSPDRFLSHRTSKPSRNGTGLYGIICASLLGGSWHDRIHQNHGACRVREPSHWNLTALKPSTLYAGSWDNSSIPPAGRWQTLHIFLLCKAPWDHSFTVKTYCNLHEGFTSSSHRSKTLG